MSNHKDKYFILHDAICSNHSIYNNSPSSKDAIDLFKSRNFHIASKIKTYYLIGIKKSDSLTEEGEYKWKDLLPLEQYEEFMNSDRCFIVLGLITRSNFRGNKYDIIESIIDSKEDLIPIIKKILINKINYRHNKLTQPDM